MAPVAPTPASTLSPEPPPHRRRPWDFEYESPSAVHAHSGPKGDLGPHTPLPRTQHSEMKWRPVVRALGTPTQPTGYHAF